MLTKTKKFFVFLVLVVCILPVFGLSSVKDYFPNFSDEQVLQLLNGGTFKAYSVDGQIPSELAPNESSTKKLALLAEDASNAFSQSLVSFVPYPESWKNYSDEEKYLAVFNLMQKVSTMKGITYSSYTAGGEATLFTEAYSISNPKKKNSKVEDFVATKVPYTRQAYAFMKDTKFGGNIYEINYFAFDNEIFLEITNVDNMKYMGISCVKDQDLHMYIDTVMADEGLIVYGLAVCLNQKPVVNVVVTKVDLPSAFLKRVDSLKNWFVNQVQGIK